ncbi:MAG TPA: hypothetical protein VK922_19080 [Gemmatimonadaceae bacterium]|nr:hypothetical protein [Gemmatimonadaceae bacterium]
MATDERKDRENETKKSEEIKDLAAKRPDAEKEEQVKGGNVGFRPIADAE